MYIRKRYLVYFCLVVIGSVTFLIHHDADDAVLEKLKTGQPEKIIPMESYLKGKNYDKKISGELHLVILQPNLKTVFRPIQGNNKNSPLAEVAAYKASKFLGFPRIPPTIVRSISGRLGSLQVYEEPSIEFNNPEQYREALIAADKDDIANLKLFYFVFGKWDVGPDSIITQFKGNRVHLTAIGNDLLTHRQCVQYGDFPYIAIAPFPKTTAEDEPSRFPFGKHTSIDKILKKHTPRDKKGNQQLLETVRKYSKKDNTEAYIAHENYLWKQFRLGIVDNEPNYTTYYPKDSIRALQRLNMNALKKIFADSEGAEFLNEAFLQDILDRRDQVLAAYQLSKTAT